MGLYDLPFDGIKGIRAEIERIGYQEKKLDQAVELLKQELFNLWGFGMPVALVRSGSKAFVPLEWRDMTRGRNRRVNIQFRGDLMQRLLLDRTVEERRGILDIELKRIHLNFALGTLRFQVARLRRLEGEFNEWRMMMRDVSQH
jgi:hypothetical protein